MKLIDDVFLDFERENPWERAYVWYHDIHCKGVRATDGVVRVEVAVRVIGAERIELADDRGANTEFWATGGVQTVYRQEASGDIDGGGRCSKLMGQSQSHLRETLR